MKSCCSWDGITGCRMVHGSSMTSGTRLPHKWRTWIRSPGSMTVAWALGVGEPSGSSGRGRRTPPRTQRCRPASCTSRADGMQEARRTTSMADRHRRTRVKTLWCSRSKGPPGRDILDPARYGTPLYVCCKPRSPSNLHSITPSTNFIQSHCPSNSLRFKRKYHT